MTALLTPAQAAQFTGIARETLAMWRSQRRGPPYVKMGRLVRYRLHDLEKYAAANTVNPLSDSMPIGKLITHEEKKTERPASSKTGPSRRSSEGQNPDEETAV